MDTQKTINAITQRIEDGFVVNEHGRWLYMAEQRIYEKRVIERIINGNVLVDGKWVAIGEARRLALRAKAPALKQPTPTQTPPPPVTPLTPRPAEADSFETAGDMMETICIDMTPAIEETAAPPGVEKRSTPAHIDSVQISGLSQSSPADQSRYAIAYIDELNHARKRGSAFGFWAKLSIALAVLAAVLLSIMRYMD